MNHAERFPPKIHDFYERLSYSESPEHEPFWQAVYQKAFPNLIFAQSCKGKCQGQYAGIDRVIQLKSGQTIKIDEKMRPEDYPDILLEYISNDKLQTSGWIEDDLLIDFLAYAFSPSKRCYLLPWQSLKRVWNHFKNDWIKNYPRIEAKNPGYKTISVAIPIPILLNEIKNSMIIKIVATNDPNQPLPLPENSD